jgi:predicted nuclease of restriction endonuclease-like (RecB) superfamily
MPLQKNKYQQILKGLKEKIKQARFKAAVTANAQLIAIYFEIGQAIIQQENEEGWGAKTVERLSFDLRMEFEDMKGLSVRNLRYMREFAKAYPQFSILQPLVAKLPKTGKAKTEPQFLQPLVAKSKSSKKAALPIVQGKLAQIETTTSSSIVQPLVAQIPWTHHTIILDRVKGEEQRLFYLQKTLENGWSKTVLSLQINNKLFERQGKTINNFESVLAALDSDLAKETFKNPYVFDFLSMGEKMQERDLEKGLINHLKNFMLELGKGFAYVGNQKNIQVEGDDYFLDLLFYNYIMHCFVVFELKIGDFKPEYAGKLNFYVNTINGQLKGQSDKATIGVLLCKTPNETVIKYSLEGIQSPIGVADYKLANTLPKQLKAGMPTMEELKKEIEGEYAELLKPLDNKKGGMKELIKDLKKTPIKKKRN